jgi:hypothetical protein
VKNKAFGDFFAGARRVELKIKNAKLKMENERGKIKD